MPDHTTADNNTDFPSAAEIRKAKRAERNALSEKTQQHHSQSLCKVLSREKIYQCSRKIGCYLANDGEIDPYLVIEHARFSCKQVYLPVLSPLQNSLYFAPYEADTRLKLNRFSIPEPNCHPSKWISARQLDLLLLPLVAFDTEGNRMGMGGGFYDRTLAYLRHSERWKKPILAGLAHEIQQTPQLAARRWDIPLDYIITEKQIYTA